MKEEVEKVKEGFGHIGFEGLSLPFDVLGILLTRRMMGLYRYCCAV